MKPVFEKTPQAQWESLHCEVVRGSGYAAAWHFHPEYQITLVLKSRGHRLVGDSVAPLAAGDLVLVGSNLPHVWHTDQDRMSRVCGYIDSHLGDAIERRAVAAEAHLSEGAFSRYFKLRTGKTLPEYVNALRVGRACRLLVETDAKVAEIAFDCGFEN